MRRIFRLPAAAILLLAFGFALPVQPLGCTQTSHYALIRSLADGTATIDRYHWQTCDKGYTDGHFYANKAPGLALLTLPAYLALDGLGAVPESPRTAIWLLGLVGVVVPAALLLLLVRRLAERIERSTATLTAVTLGLATLVLPFSTLFFSHLLAALLGLACFALLWHEREGPKRLTLLALAGLAAGLAVTSEYPLALVGLVMGVYAISRGEVVRRGLAYSGGFLAGIAPLLAYNAWAFGSLTHLSYADTVINQGESGHDVVAQDAGGFFGISAPSPRVALELLLAPRGLVTLAPVLVLGALGTVALARRGRRAEALAIAAVALAYLVENAGFYVPFGGDVPGPRYLIPLLPFLALPLALAYRAVPATSAALAAVSALGLAAATATEPMLGDERTGRWLERVQAGDFTHSVVTLAGGGHGWLATLPFAGALIGAAALAVRSSSWRLSGRDCLLAAVALAGWALLAAAAPTLLATDRAGGGWAGTVAAALLASTAVLAGWQTFRRGLVGTLPALPLAALLVPPLAEHSRWALLTVLATLAGYAVLARDRWRPPFLRALRRARDFVRRRLLGQAALFLFLASFLLFYGQLDRKQSADTYGEVYTAVALVRTGSFRLDPYLPTLQERAGERPYMVATAPDGHRYSHFPVATSLFAVPAVALLAAAGVPPERFGAQMEAGMATGALVSALSVALLFVLLTRLTSRERAFLLAGLTAVGTMVWTVAGQGLWQHGPVLLALVGGLLALVDRRPLLAGFALAAMVAVRPSTLVLALPLLALLEWRRPRSLALAALGALPPALLLAAYNWLIWGSPWSAAYEENPLSASGGFSGSFWEGLSGNLLSPGRGLFAYSPFLLFALAGAVLGRRSLLYSVCAAAFVAQILLVSRWYEWWGGEAFGPRQLLDALPLAVILLVPAFERWSARPWFAWSFGLLAAWSVAVHFLGAALWPGTGWYDAHEVRELASWWNPADSELTAFFADPERLARRAGAALAICAGALVAAYAASRIRARRSVSTIC